MPTTYAIPNGSTAFAATLYTGNGTSQSVSNALNGTSFQPDFVWYKQRNTARSNGLEDSVRGAQKILISDTTAAEVSASGITSFNSNGFTQGSNVIGNESSGTYVAWQWKANGAAVTNTAGSITSQVSANTAAGFSVVTYTGTGANATVGHGLGVAPSMVIVKVRGGVDNWTVYRSDFSSPANDYLQLNTTIAKATYSVGNGIWNGGANSTTFGVGPLSAINQSANTFVAYCFAAVAGYSAFGSYTGNGSTDGVFVYTGFRPRWILVKSSSAAEPWNLVDTSRDSYNVMANYLQPNSAGAEGSITFLDSLSNGFKLRSSGAGFNGSGQTFIYACFAENPLKYANAR